MTDELQAKLSDRELRIQQARRTRLMRRLLIVAVIAVVVAGLVLLIVWRSRQSSNGPGMTIPDQGRDHVALGTPFTYNSNPPTSGSHTANVYEWDVYQEELQDQSLIHNLEHGGIWIAYKPGIPQDIIAKLEGIAREFGRKVIMAPRDANDSDIALAAWNHLDKFSATEFSEERVRTFIQAYRNRGPEFVP